MFEKGIYLSFTVNSFFVQDFLFHSLFNRCELLEMVSDYDECNRESGNAALIAFRTYKRAKKERAPSGIDLV